jgi:intraflagellar transport protein 172
VWYNINAPDQITIHTIKGDIEEIERIDGRTEVVVDEGMEQAVYPLDGSLIEFGTAIDDHDFLHAMEVLENLELSPEAEAMWQQLSIMALEENEFRIAQRCQAAVGNISMCKYLGKINKVKELAEEELGMNGTDHYKVSTSPLAHYPPAVSACDI